MQIIQWANKEGWTIRGEEIELEGLRVAIEKAQRQGKAICQADRPIEIELEY